MLNIDSLENGIVIDHIAAGSGMQIYKLLHLDQLDCCVAVIQNAKSTKYGRKDIIKIDGIIDLDLDILGYVDHNVTVDVIQNGRIAEKKKLVLPKRLKNVIRCKNPRCITSAEPGIDQIFRLCGEDNRSYRCIYCEQKYK
ncbi:aspartate carbamoyltransferase regulatory subunit [Yeguia hominis]|uniref:Aspartate carbamoyltransferase regulatory subunit n=1 Tax=Yeguia hominis TaxID=2763662 RepID=A0A926HS16_9FIRM|nr:aspartate carbamoyltransferase regulatory subunit [Yeguia hominis]MBC8533823.1 aspartate carbamoyltransferase regulatory subunit [Yeguia hominis]